MKRARRTGVIGVGAVPGIAVSKLAPRRHVDRHRLNIPRTLKNYIRDLFICNRLHYRRTQRLKYSSKDQRLHRGVLRRLPTCRRAAGRGGRGVSSLILDFSPRGKLRRDGARRGRDLAGVFC
jgi:hypothetical protein